MTLKHILLDITVSLALEVPYSLIIRCSELESKKTDISQFPYNNV